MQFELRPDRGVGAIASDCAGGSGHCPEPYLLLFGMNLSALSCRWVSLEGKIGMVGGVTI